MTRLKADARNRALRSFLNGLAFAVLTAVVMVLYPVFTSAQGWSDFNWKLLGFSLVQAVGVAIFAYLMRTVLDPSKVPTPLPPADALVAPQGKPFHDPDVKGPGQAGYADVQLVLLIAILIGVLLLLFRVHFGS